MRINVNLLRPQVNQLKQVMRFKLMDGYVYKYAVHVNARGRTVLIEGGGVSVEAETGIIALLKDKQSDPSDISRILERIGSGKINFDKYAAKNGLLALEKELGSAIAHWATFPELTDKAHVAFEKLFPPPGGTCETKLEEVDPKNIIDESPADPNGTERAAFDATSFLRKAQEAEDAATAHFRLPAMSIEKAAKLQGEAAQLEEVQKALQEMTGQLQQTSGIVRRQNEVVVAAKEQLLALKEKLDEAKSKIQDLEFLLSNLGLAHLIPGRDLDAERDLLAGTEEEVMQDVLKLKGLDLEGADPDKEAIHQIRLAAYQFYSGDNINARAVRMTLALAAETAEEEKNGNS